MVGVTRSFRVLMNYPADGSEAVPIELIGTSEAADTGGDRLAVDVGVRGVRIAGEGDTAQAAIEVVSDIRARVGAPGSGVCSPRRPARGAGTGIGSTVTLTSTDARAINPTQAVNAVPCRVVGLVRDLDANRLALEVRPMAASAPGYAPSLRVESVVDSDTVVVEADAFSDDDLSRFAASDAVACIPLATGRAGTTASSRPSTPTREVSFTVGHGLAAGDIIRPDDYDTATGRALRSADSRSSPTIPTRRAGKRHGAGHRIARSRAASTERRHDAARPCIRTSRRSASSIEQPATGLRTR